MSAREAPARTAGMTPEKLALLVRRAQQKRRAAEAAEASPAGRIPRRAGGGPAPLSFAQQRLWLLDLLEPGSTAYNMPCPVRLRGELDVAALAGALDEVVRRHAALRTTFRAVDGVPVQIISPPAASWLLPLIDLSGLAEPARSRETARLVAEESKRAFDLARGPLLRASLLRRAGTDHLLFLDVHHIVSDGWSLGVLFRELSVLYGACRGGEPSPLPELPLQFADFAAWQRDWLQGEVLAEQLAYWRRRLAGSPPALELPTDRLRPAVQTHRGVCLRHDLPRQLAERLRALSQHEGASLFMTLLAGFDLLLSRLSGQEDLVVGSPSAGRGRVEVEGLIGLFLNTLVLRTDLSGEPSFRELLGRVKEGVLGAYQYQDLPFEKLIEELQPERQLSRTPIFQVLFNFVSVADAGLALAGVAAEPLSPPQPDAKFDFTLYVEAAAESIHLQLVYNADLFEPPRMEEMLRQLEHLLAQAAADAAAPIGALSLVTPAAAAVLPDPVRPLDGEWRGTVQAGLSRHAARTPARLAVRDEQGAAWTYGELEARSNRLARFLLAHGVEKGDTVAVWAHRSAPLVQALMATLKAGAAFMILDPAYPAPRLLDYLRIARPTAWIAVPGAPAPAAPVAAAAGICRCRIDLAAPAALAAFPESAPAVPIDADDIACITFTSGSTGLPKGVVGRHGPLTHFYPWMGERFGLGGDDRFGMLSALAHDPLQRDVFTPLWFGASLAIPEADPSARPGYLAAWARRAAVSVLHLTPAMMELVIESTREEPAGGLPALRLAFVVGDLLKKADVESFQRLAPALTCVNLYGSTETQRSVSYFVVPRPEEPAAARLGREVLPLGGGMEDVQLLVLNRAGGLAGIGEAGEIHVRSRHLARGYLGDDALTAERFLANPFTHGAADRIYKTGDLGRYLPGGGVEFAGRADHQVKLRGFRIELGEVEAALARYPGIQECVAIVREDRPGDRRLAAYLVAEGSGPRARELRAFLAQRLPDYMVPSAFMVLPALPLTRTGKVDRRALPPPAEERSEEGIAEPSQVAELLAGIWAGLLGVARVAPGDNFFDLGGQSLLATRMASRVRRLLGVELPMRAVFEEPTLAGFAALVERAQHEAAVLRPAPPLVPVARGGALPLSFSQQRLWFLDQLEPASFAYNLAGAVRLSGPLEIRSLGVALSGIVRRHEALRTTFAQGEDEPRQVISEPAPLPLPLLDLAALPAAAREAESRRVATAAARRPYDLARGPLVRCALLRLEEGEHALVVGMHHAVADGWSMSIFVRELGALYRGLVTGEPAALPELPIQYADFAVWQRDWLQDERLAERLAWWTAQLAGAPQAVELPLDRPRPPIQSFRGGRAEMEIGGDLRDRLEALARRLGVTSFMLLLAGFATLLARYSDQSDLVVGTPIAGRGHAELEDLIGFFVNTLALRLDLSADPAFGELARRVREMALGAYAHQDMPFDRLVDELRPQRDLSRAPVFQVTLALQNFPFPHLDLAGLSLSPLAFDLDRSRYDLSLFLLPRPGREGVLAQLEYASDLFDAATIQRLLGHFHRLLEGVVGEDAASVRLSELPLMGEEESEQILRPWHGGAAAGQREATVLELLAEQVRRAPEAPAVVCGGEVLTYAELDRRARRLARRLRGLGVGPESLVAILLERSPELVVAALAVLQAGGGYLPIDPAYPAARARFILRDSAARVLITAAGALAALPEPPLPPASVLRIDEEDFAADAAETVEPVSGLGPDGLAYVIYTSGSSGAPKGTELRHGGLSNLVAWHLETYGLGPGDRSSLLAGPGFDASVWEMWPPLAAGAALHVPAAEVLASPADLLAWWAGEGITVAFLPTPLAEAVLAEPMPRDLALRVLLTGGDRLHRRPSADLPFALVNHYGPTECTVVTTAGEVASQGWRVPDIGAPIAHTQAHLLDRALRPVPVGIPGELCVAGSGLARGYRGRGELTAERFVPNPWADRRGERLYRTGDLARRLPDGRLEFLGRLDRQVKLRGFRIELGEIESALLAQPGIAAAAVVLREDRPGDKRLVAYVAASEGEPLAAGLRQALAQRLPDYMVPAVFVALRSLPLTPNGKIDLQALPAPDGERAGPGVDFVAPRHPVEEVLAAVWAEVLHAERVGIHDNFFALGGDSIRTIQVVARSRKQGIRVTAREIFQHQTIAELAAVAQVAAPPAVAVPEIPPSRTEAREAGALTPADFPVSRLDQTELDELLAELG